MNKVSYLSDDFLGLQVYHGIRPVGRRMARRIVLAVPCMQKASVNLVRKSERGRESHTTATPCLIYY